MRGEKQRCLSVTTLGYVNADPGAERNVGSSAVQSSAKLDSPALVSGKMSKPSRLTAQRVGLVRSQGGWAVALL